jgi:hypothetical protein
MTTVDLRQKHLLDWLTEHLGLVGGTLTAASADASFRRYFRYHRDHQPSVVVMDAPPDREAIGPFIEIANALVAMGVRAPIVHHHCEQRGFVVLEDLGSTWLLTSLQNAAEHAEVTAWYQRAFDELFKLQSQGVGFAERLPAYDEALLLREMNLLPEWFLTHHLKLTLNDDDRHVIATAFAQIVNQVAAQPTTLVHRDYHSRNLMVLADRSLGVIDFQDAVRGPMTYDWVSVLKDCYVHWPKTWVRQWVTDFYAQWQARNLTGGVSLEQWLLDFEWMGLQRHLKVLGIFARLYYRDHKPQYLNDLPMVMAYVEETLSELTALAEFWQWWQRRVQPAWRQLNP